MYAVNAGDSDGAGDRGGTGSAGNDEYKHGVSFFGLSSSLLFPALFRTQFYKHDSCCVSRRSNGNDNSMRWCNVMLAALYCTHKLISVMFLY